MFCVKITKRTIYTSNKLDFTENFVYNSSVLAGIVYGRLHKFIPGERRIYMKFERLVSAASALAVSVTVFAGMALTANAAEDTVNATLSHTAGTRYSSAGTGCTLDSELEYFNMDANSGWVGYAFAKFDFAIPDGTNVVSATLTWGGTSSRDYSTSIYYLNSGVEFPFDSMVEGTNYRYANEKTFVASEPTLQNGKTGITTDVTGAIKAVQDQGTVTFQWTGNNGSGNLYGKGSENAPTLSITVTTEALEYAENVTVNYVCDGNAVADPSVIDVSDQVLGTGKCTYKYPAYILKDNVLYKAESDNYVNEIVLAEKNKTVNVEYKSLGQGSYQYMEFDGLSTVANAEKASNGEMKNGIQDGIQTITVAEDGIYDVIIATGRSAEEATSSRDGSWYVNQNTQDSHVLTFSGPNPGEHEYKDIALKSGDVITVDGSNSKCALDYVVIIKTGEIKPTADASCEGTFEGTDGTKASVWSAVLKGNGTTYNKINATATASDDSTATNSIDTATITTTGDVNIFVYVNKAQTDLKSVSVSAE